MSKNKNKSKNNFLTSHTVPSKNLSLDNPERLKVVSVQQFSGPLPNPEILKKYDDISPGAARIIIERSEKQSEHRISLESSVIKSDIENSVRGSWFGFIISMTVIIGGFILIINDKSWIGLAAILGALASLVSVFIYSNKERREEREREREKRSYKLIFSFFFMLKLFYERKEYSIF